MSTEATLFFLRLLAGLSLAGFLLTLFFLIWRSMKGTEQQLRTARSTYGYLVRKATDPAGIAVESERHALQAITTVGRSAGNSIVVADDFASIEHARIVLENGDWWLEDRNSSNGTRLNEEKIEQRTILTDGDLIGIGEDSFRLQLEADLSMQES